MKFLIDADCPRSIGDILKAAGHQVQDIRNIDPAASDQEIYKLIKKDSYILITRDTDFGNILRYPVTPTGGIILLRVYLLSVPEIGALIKDILAKIPPADLTGSLIVARKDKYRIRKT